MRFAELHALCVKMMLQKEMFYTCDMHRNSTWTFDREFMRLFTSHIFPSLHWEITSTHHSVLGGTGTILDKPRWRGWRGALNMEAFVARVYIHTVAGHFSQGKLRVNLYCFATQRIKLKLNMWVVKCRHFYPLPSRVLRDDYHDDGVILACAFRLCDDYQFPITWMPRLRHSWFNSWVLWVFLSFCHLRLIPNAQYLTKLH